MIKQIADFAAMFQTKLPLEERLLRERNHRIFLLNKTLEEILPNNFLHAGIYLGKIEDGIFVPSFSMLNMISAITANKVFIDKRTEWLFICGRDIFMEGIMRIEGSTEKGTYVLVLNSRNECLGFGRTMLNLEHAKKGLAVENLLDIGDFLRREH